MLNPEKNTSGAENAEQTLGDVREEAANLAEKVADKPLFERVFSEYQTRRTKLRGNEIEPNEGGRRFEKSQIDRGEAFRFERGQIYKAYKTLRQEIRGAEKGGKDAVSKRLLLKDFKEKARQVERDLDELNRQYYENVRAVKIETKFGDFEIPVVELDLRKDGEGPEKDERMPEFFIGSVATNYHKSACFAMARAMQGHKVYIPMYPEQDAAGKPDDFVEVLKARGDLKLHAEVMRRVIAGLDLKEFNLTGYSMGAAVSMEIAQDPETEGLNNLVLMEPLAIQNKGLLRLAREFTFDQGLIKTFTSREATIKCFSQGEESEDRSDILLLTDANILSKELFTSESLSGMRNKGRLQVWAGGKSPVVDVDLARRVFMQADTLRAVQQPQAFRLEFYEVKGADHGLTMVNSIGLARMIDQQKSKMQDKIVKNKDLGNSAAEWVLRDLAKGAK